MSALNSFLKKGKRKKRATGKPKPAVPVNFGTPAAAPKAAAPSVAPVAAPAPAPAPASSGWIEADALKSKVVLRQKVADLNDIGTAEQENFSHLDEEAERAKTRSALLRTMKRAKRNEQRALAAKDDDSSPKPVEEKKEATTAFVPWRVRAAKSSKPTKSNAPPKFENESEFPTLGGAPAAPAKAAPAASAWGAVQVAADESSSEEELDDDPPPPLEPAGTPWRGEKAKAADGSKVEEEELDLALSDEAWDQKVDFMISNFQDTQRHTDVTDPMSEVTEEDVVMARRTLIVNKALQMGIWGNQREREGVNKLLPRLLMENVLDRPTLRAGVLEVFAELDDLCRDEPNTPLYVAQMIKKVNFRGVVHDSDLPQSVKDGLAGTFKPRQFGDDEPEEAAAAPAPATAEAPAPEAAAPPTAPADAEPAAAAEEDDENADLFAMVGKKKKKKKKKAKKAE